MVDEKFLAGLPALLSLLNLDRTTYYRQRARNQLAIDPKELTLFLTIVARTSMPTGNRSS